MFLTNTCHKAKGLSAPAYYDSEIHMYKVLILTFDSRPPPPPPPPPLLTVSISLSQSSSPLLREEITELLQKWAVERVQDPGTPGLLFLAISCPKKERKITSCNRSVYTKSVHKETTFQD